MDKYRNSRISLNSTFPITNCLLKTGPLYTMCEPKSQQQGPQLLMNSAAVGTATQFQFIPARHSPPTFSGLYPIEMGSTILSSVKTFFVNLIKPKVDLNTMSHINTIEKRKCNSAPNIYMDSMSCRKCSDEFEKNSYVDLSDSEMLEKLSASTKSFSDYNLPTSTIKINCTSKSPGVTKKMDLNVSEEPQPEITKEIEEIEVEMTASVVKSHPPQPHSKQLKRRKKMPKVPTKPRSQCPKEKEKTKKRTKKSSKIDKNKKEKVRHELALNIHEDVDTETENMSTDEWEQPLVIITESKTRPIEGNAISEVVCFSKDDFPAMPECSALNSRNNSNYKQTWELPRLSHCFTSLKGTKQRQISECDSEDSFIVFDSDDKATLSSVKSNQSICDRIRSTLSSGGRRQISESSEDDFICFEMETSDTDDADDCDDGIISDSECDSEVDDLKSIGTDAHDSSFGDKKVRFNLNPVVHVLRTWSFAYRQARKGQWEQNGRDRDRFHNRIKRLESTLLPVLDSDHRQKIFCDRFLRDADNDICDSAIEK